MAYEGMTERLGTTFYLGVPEDPELGHVGRILFIQRGAVSFLRREGYNETRITCPKYSDGFGWSYMGTGPRATAEALLRHALRHEPTDHLIALFHRKVVATLPNGPWTLTRKAIRAWVATTDEK